MTPPRLSLVDEAESTGRVTSSLVASLGARLAALHLVSGADAVGSLMAGYCALGREVSQTAEGARLRRALEGGRPGTNGDLLWARFRVGDWVSSLPASPVLDQLRNDVALLLAEDVAEALDALPFPTELAGDAGPGDERAVFLDLVLGLYAFSLDLVRAVEALAEPTLEAPGSFAVGAEPAPEVGGSLLR